MTAVKKYSRGRVSKFDRILRFLHENDRALREAERARAALPERLNVNRMIAFVAGVAVGAGLVSAW